jgi:hypothetical protein
MMAIVNCNYNARSWFIGNPNSVLVPMSCWCRTYDPSVNENGLWHHKIPRSVDVSVSLTVLVEQVLMGTSATSVLFILRCLAFDGTGMDNVNQFTYSQALIS